MSEDRLAAPLRIATRREKGVQILRNRHARIEMELLQVIAGGAAEFLPILIEVGPELGFVPQEIALYPDLTARENLDAFGRFHGLRGGELRQAVLGSEVTDQAAIDRLMLELDGTENKGRLGANALLAVSLAAAHAALADAGPSAGTQSL